MKKIFSLLTAILFVGTMWATDETLTITGASSGNNAPWGTSYTSNSGTATTSASNSIGITWSNVGRMNTGIQIKNSSGAGFYSTSYPSTNNIIKSINITGKTNTSNIVLSCSADGSKWDTKSFTSGTDLDVSSSKYKYFKVTQSSAYVVLTSIVVTYTTASTNPTISADPDSIGFGIKNIYKNEAAKTGSATIKVTGEYLTANISAALDFGTNFTLPISSLDKGAKDADFTVNYTVNAAGLYDDTLRLTSTGATEVKIPITLKVVNELRVIDTLTIDNTGVTSSGYTEFSAKGACTDAEYSGRCSKSASIQLNATSPNGIVTTFSDGLARKVSIVWNSGTTDGRYVEIYGSNTAYEGSADLYDFDKDGTLIGTIKKGTNTELVIEDDYEYIGLLASASLKMDTVFITWAPEEKDAVSISEVVGGTLTVRKKAVLDEKRTVSNGDKVAEGKVLVVAAEANNTTHMGGTVAAYKTGDPDTKVTITNGELTMPEYPITISATFDPRPRVEMSPKALNFGTKVEQGDEVAAKTFTITGADLTGELTVTAPTGYTASCTSGSLTPAAGVVNAEITVTPATTEFGTFNGNITINGGGLKADTAVVAVAMTVIAKSTITIANPANGVITVKDADDNAVAPNAKMLVGKRMKVTVAPNDEKTHRETLKIYKTGDDKTIVPVDENDSITMPDYPITITADEVELYAVNLVIKVDGEEAAHGNEATIAGGTETIYKAAGETVALTATRTTGYQFAKWTTSSTNIVIAATDSTKTSALSVTVNGAGTIYANFTAVPELLVSVTELDLKYAKLNAEPVAQTFTIQGASLAEGTLTLTLADNIKDAFIVSPNTVDVKGTLATTTITVTPVTTKAGNYSGNLTIAGGGLAAAKTVALTSEIEQTYTVTWNVNGQTTTQTDIAGTTLNAPATGSITGKVSQGWTDAVIDGKTNTKPTIVTLTTMPDKDTTLYALYATENSVDSVCRFSYKITTSDFPGSGYDANDGDREVEAVCTTDATLKVDVEWTSYQMCVNANKVQGKGNKGKVYNKSAWGRGIYDITFVSNSGFTATKTGAFFEVKAGSSASTTTSIEITFDSLVNVTTYDAYITNAYAVNFTATSELGEIAVKNGDDEIESGDLFPKGTEFTVVTTPADGYMLSVLKANTTDITTTKAFTMGSEAVNVTATFVADSGTGIDNAEEAVKAVKVVENDQVIIIRGNKRYTVQGQLIR